MHASASAILSLIATAFTGVVFVMAVSEARSVEHGQDPITNQVRAALRRYPRFTYVVAVTIGMLMGHLFWT
ncbi:MAG: hypothetical protein M3077_14020 [Candidatus Dormibacteraeota bacterium]|nr:hypothetical protein [Candidatus Dormibacteraeota bacterium]